MLLLIAGLVAGCSTGKSGSVSDSSGTSKGVLKVGWGWDLAPADPLKGGFYRTAGIMETLVDLNYDGSLKPELAVAWESLSPTVWKFTLRPGVRFHDGTSLDSKAVKFVFDRLAANSKFIPVSSVETPADNEVIIKTSKPFVAMPAYCANTQTVIYASGSVQDGKFTRPVGTGPYQFIEYTPDKGVYCQAFQNYWKEAPKISEVVFKYIPDGQTRVMALQSGEVDLIHMVPPASAKVLASNPDFVVQSAPVTRMQQINLNPGKAPLDDLNVRQAINHAIDRKAIVDSVLEGYGEPAVGLFPPNLPWGSPNLKGYPYDPGKAGDLLEKAGWKDVDGDGVRENKGNKLELVLESYPARPEIALIAEAVQAQLGAVGIRVKIETKEYGAVYKSLMSKKYDMALMSWGVAFTPDPSVALDFFKSDSKVQWRANYDNPRVDNLLDQALDTTDEKKRQELYEQVQEIIEQDAPVAFLNYYVQIDAHKKSLQNYRIHPTETHVITEKLSFKK
jgi:peptide/nickel transport system substrate-binding protein